MNKIFKIIWSKARNCYVVVSELAKSHDDGHVRRSRSGCCRKAAVLAAFVLTTSLLAAPDWAQAAAATNSGNPSANQAVNIENKNNTTAQGTDAYATYDSQGNLIMGKDNEVVPIQKDSKTGNARVDSKPENVVMGTRNGVGKFTHSTETKKPISGDDSYAYQKLDTEWITVKVYNPNTNTYDDKQVEVYKLTPGQYMDDEYNVRAKRPTLADYNYNQEAYNQALNVYNSVANYLNDDRTRQSYYVSGATAVGVDNVAEGDRSTAIGNKAKVLNSVGSYYVDAYGKLTRDQDAAYYYLDEQGRITTTPQYVKDSNGQYVKDTNGNYIKTSFLTVPRLIDSTDAVALGSDVTAEGRSAVAIGHQSYAKEYSVAIGENSVTDYMGVAIGKDNKAKYASTAIGHTNDANGYYTATMGVNNTAHGDYSSAIGYQNTIDALQASGSERKAYESHAFGSENTIKGDYNLAAGDKNSIDKISGMAVGVGNKISMDHNPGNSNPINLDNQSGDYSIAVGLGNKSEKNALVIGKYSSALHDGSIAIGNSVNSNENNNNGANDSIAIGTGSKAMTQDSIAFGHGATIGNNNTQGINGAIAIGKGADAENGQSLAIGYEAYTGNNKDVATNKDGSIIAIGTNAQAMAGYDIAIGAKASTASSKTSNSGGSAVAIGYNAVINDGAQRSVAMGANASVALNVQDAVALGSQSYVEQNQGANHQGGYDPSAKGIAHGDANSSTKDPVWNSTLGPISVGSASHWDNATRTQTAQQTRQITNVAAGKDDTDAVNVAQLKQVVSLVNNSGGGGTGGSGVHDYSVKSVNPGTDTNYNNGGASGDNALAAGVSASATGAHSVAVGNGATAKGQDSIALGTGAVADGIGATAIGQYNTASGQNSLAFGGGYNKDQKGNTASGVASVAFGEGTQAIAEGTLAFGENTQAGSTEKDKQGNLLGQNAVAFGNGTKATGGRSLAFGERTLASANDATAFGNESVASNTGATAFGNKNQATGQYATAWGGGDKVVDNGDGTTTKVGTVASGTYATAFGERTEASGESATAFGSDSTASGKNAAAFGENSTASGEASTAFGIGSTAVAKNSLAALGGTVAESAENAVAIGKDAQAKLADTVALGSGSVADRQSGVKGYDAATGAETTQTSAAWVSKANAIAVGNGSTLTRQITGVAAGSLDTDAVNVAQLKAVDAKHTIVTVGGQAVTADNTPVTGGNLDLKRTTATNGQETYDLKLNDNITLGKDGADGREGTIGLTGKDGLPGADGKQGYSTTIIKTEKGQPGADGKNGKPGVDGKDITRIVYTDKDGSNPQTVATMDDGLKFAGDDGAKTVAKKLNDTLQIRGDGTYDTAAHKTKEDGNIQVSADTDTGTIKVSLSDKINLHQDGYLTVGGSKNGEAADGSDPIVIKNFGAGELTVTGTDKDGKTPQSAAGDYVTGLDNKDWDVSNPTYVSGRAATEDQLKKVNDAVKDAAATAGKHTVVTVNDKDGHETKAAAGDGVFGEYAGTDTDNLLIAAKNNNGQMTYNIKLNDQLAIGQKGESGVAGKDGKDGKVTVETKGGTTVVIGHDGEPGKNGKDGISVKGQDGKDGVTISAVNGKDGTEGHIGLTGPKGADGKNANIDISTVLGKATLDRNQNEVQGDDKDGAKDQASRIQYQTTVTDKDGTPRTITHEVATMDDGQKYVGDVKDSDAKANAFSRKLNEQINVVGGVTNLDDLSKGNNVGVVSNGKDTLTIRLAKKLTDLTSVTTVTKDDKGNKTSETVQDGNGITITPSTLGTGKSAVSLTDNGLSNGGNQITHVDSGLKDAAGNKVELKDAAGDMLNNAVNVGDLQKVQNVASAHTAVTVNSGVEAPEAGADGKLGAYTDKGKGNLLLAQKKDSTTGKITYDLKLNDNVTLGKDGVDGREGTIGLTGKDGLPGADGKQGYSTTIIKTEKGQPGADGKNGKPGVDGKDITRIVYTDKDGSNPQTVATMDDGLKFAGDDGAKTVAKKLNDTLQIRGDGTYDKNQNTVADDGNIRTSVDNGAVKISLSDKINLHQDGYLTVGGSKNSGAADGSDPIVIKNFGAGELTVTGTDKDGKTPQSAAGDYVTGLDNKNWDVSNPTYVSGRAATEDQLKKISDTIKTNAETAAGQHTAVTVNDKDSSETTASVGTDGAYGSYSDASKGNLLIAAKTKDGKTTYNIKLNDNLAIGQKGADGKDGKDGKVTVDTKGGTTVVIGHDGEPGKDGKDGISVKGQDGKDGVTISVTNGKDGKDGSEGHIGLTGPAGKDGKDASADIHVQNGQNGVDGTDGNNGKDGMDRVVYEDHNGKTHEVATMDDGLKFVGNDGQEVIRKLNSTLSIKGGLDKGAVAQASSKNLGVRQNATKDGLEIVMTDTPDFTKVTVGGDKKITIGGQTNSDTKNPANGNYITGLDNTKWDKDHVTENRAATEGQLRDVAGSITNQSQGGGFGLADEAGNTVRKDLGQTVTVKGDGKNIETKVNGGALEVSLKKDVDLGNNGSIKAGDTTIDKDGVKTNEVKVGDITITKDGINGGAKQITNIGSGIDGKQYATAGDNNAASIGDVKKIAGDEASKAADAVKSKSGKNITVKDDHTVNLNDSITLGDETDVSKQVSIDGNGAKVTAGDGANKVTVDGSKGQVTIGSGDKTLTLGKQANTAGDSNPAEGNYLNGLDNTQWDGEHIQSGRAATEDQLKTVSDKVNSGRKFQGDDGQDVTVGMGDTLKIQGGVKAEDVSQENNIGIVKGADDTLNIRLAKDLKGLDSVTTGDTTINNSGLTVKGDDNHKAITIQQGNVNMGGNTIEGVAPGKISKDSTDAVNGSQLWQRDQAINGLSGSVNKLGNRINRVGAGAAALAALHPLDFDPDDKWDFAAGYGNYRGANAAAIGAYYRPNEDTMFSVGGSFGGGENMVNAGVSIKLGQGNHVSTSRVAMAKEMKAMRQHMAEQDALIAKLQSMHGMAVDPAKSTLFPDVAENHWAYQYVTTLAKKGILEGYPDGEFKGDRMMTRYEFAAIVYRIVESGVGSTDPELSKLVKEFSPELQYIRIDTIQKDRNGKPTIERVRVISDAK
ncbi:ESPR-type extended signal peptide-containing protein [Megasphaera sp. WILCCON 0056]|uniref:ESPR-type extended signal peptide-containing protein n=2 Tax=unclassified Megasphaera TaxID=2626256 RepID=UPI003A813049